MSESVTRASLKVGDQAIIHTGYSYGTDEVVVITAVTKTQLRVGDKAYLKSTGKLVGTSNSRWSGGPRLMAATATEIQRVKDANEKTELVERLHHLAPKQSLAVLRQMAALLVERVTRA